MLDAKTNSTDGPEQRSGDSSRSNGAPGAGHSGTGAAGAGTGPAPQGGISEARRVAKGKPDAHGDTVTDIFVGTEQFIIYIAANGAGDRGRLRYVLPDAYDVARQLRGRLMPIVGDLAYVGDVVAALPGGAGFGRLMPSQYATLRKRTLDLMARAMQAAFEDHPEAAAALVERAREEAVSRRDSRNRMRYIFANALTLAAILAVWLGGGLFGLALPGQLTELRSVLPGAFATAPASGAEGAFSAIDVLALGALGAFFAVSAAINQVRVNHTISVWEMLYAGFVRVPIGVIAAGVVIFLMSGGWIVASIGDAYRLPSLYLFGFLAGFSELFVPNALKQVETSAKVERPAAGGQAPPG